MKLCENLERKSLTFSQCLIDSQALEANFPKDDFPQGLYKIFISRINSLQKQNKYRYDSDEIIIMKWEILKIARKQLTSWSECLNLPTFLGLNLLNDFQEGYCNNTRVTSFKKTYIYTPWILHTKDSTI